MHEIGICGLDSLGSVWGLLVGSCEQDNASSSSIKDRILSAMPNTSSWRGA
jgi:hypothetical protein